MWAFFEDGTFYSAVNDFTDEGVKWVRTRDLRSATILAEWLRTVRDDGKARIIPLKDADYAYRLETSSDEWTEYLIKKASEAKATNFKSEVARNTDDKKFIHALHNVWWEMYDYQKETRGW